MEAEARVTRRPPLAPPGGYGSGPSSRHFGPTLEESGPRRSLGPFVTAVAMIVGVSTILLLVVVGCRRYIAVAKTAEVRQGLSTIAVDAAAVYERDRRVCPSATLPVPTDAQFSGDKYQSINADWATDAPQNAGFACLGFAMDRMQYFQYRYEATPSSFVARGRGDLDRNGVFSEFSWTGKVVAGHVVIAPGITEKNADE